MEAYIPLVDHAHDTINGTLKMVAGRSEASLRAHSKTPGVSTLFYFYCLMVYSFCDTMPEHSDPPESCPTGFETCRSGNLPSMVICLWQMDPQTRFLAFL